MLNLLQIITIIKCIYYTLNGRKAFFFNKTENYFCVFLNDSFELLVVNQNPN